jgi:hypothetical protein
VPRALSKSLARVGISKPVAHSRNASATGGLPTVLLPWNLGSYEPMNNFHPLFRKWVQAQTSVRFVRPPWAKELCQSPRYREDCSNTQYLEHGFGRVFEFEKQENSSVSRNLFLAADYLLLPNFIIRYHSLLRRGHFSFIVSRYLRFLCRWVFRVRNLTASSYQTFCRSIERYSNRTTAWGFFHT